MRIRDSTHWISEWCIDSEKAQVSHKVNVTAQSIYVVNNVCLESDWLYTFFHKLSELELGTAPNKSILRSPFASRGTGWAELDEGTEIGVGSL